MNRISKAFLACTCGLFCLGIQAQNHTTWTNDFSNTGETHESGRSEEHAALPIMYSVPKAPTLSSVIPNGQITRFPSKPVPLKMPNKCRYGRASVITTDSTDM